MLDPATTVGGLVLDHPECARVFSLHRIDYCCRGELSITEAAGRRGVAPAALIAELETAIAERQVGPGDSVKDLPTTALIQHIVRTHHVYLRRTLPFLGPLSAKVARVHGDRHPRLYDVEAAVAELSAGLLAHLDDEEERLFPALQSLDAAIEPAVARALRSMRDEHLEVASLLEIIRDATEQFAIPDGACGSFRTLFRELEALEQDIFRHVHLENHVLAPRFEARAVAVTGSALQVPLAANLTLLRQSSAYVDGGHGARTLVRGDDTRMVLLALKAGACLREHRTEHKVIVQTLEGHVQLQLADQVVELPAGNLLVLEPGAPHDVTATVDSAVLVIIAWQPVVATAAAAPAAA